jgi:hypothetical protein
MTIRNEKKWRISPCATLVKRRVQKSQASEHLGNFCDDRGNNDQRAVVRPVGQPEIRD